MRKLAAILGVLSKAQINENCNSPGDVEICESDCVDVFAACAVECGQGFRNQVSTEKIKLSQVTEVQKS